MRLQRSKKKAQSKKTNDTESQHCWGFKILPTTIFFVNFKNKFPPGSNFNLNIVSCSNICFC